MLSQVATSTGPPQSATIGCLLFGCGPTAIIRFVIAIIVDSIERVLRARSLTHVRVKRAEVVLPAFAYRDAAPTIIGVSRVSDLRTAASHIAPSVPFGRLAEAVRQMVLLAHFRAASALLPSSASQFGLKGCVAVAAIAHDVPRPLRSAMSQRENEQVPKSLADQISWFRSHVKQLIHGVKSCQ